MEIWMINQILEHCYLQISCMASHRRHWKIFFRSSWFQAFFSHNGLYQISNYLLHKRVSIWIKRWRHWINNCLADKIAFKLVLITMIQTWQIVTNKSVLFASSFVVDRSSVSTTHSVIHRLDVWMRTHIYDVVKNGFNCQKYAVSVSHVHAHIVNSHSYIQN